MSDIAIKVENVSKKYQIGENKTYPTLRDKLMEIPNRLFKGPKKTKEFWALKDVSFEIKKGEVVGIIGRNGAGKSTMLKILARITEPTSGKITMYGRVASMLEVGTGFNPELTGRENIYLNGAIIGMKKSEINTKFNDIVEFSGVGKFLDTPVKHYSSGMYVRLAFAVAAHLDADILLVDEVLAVGDAEFQKKCLGKMSDIAQSGRTVIFVSHDSRAIQALCKKTILFTEGKFHKYDSTDIVLSHYNDAEKVSFTENFIFKRSAIDIKKGGIISKVKLSQNGKDTNHIKYGSELLISLETVKNNKSFIVEVIIKSENNEPILYCTSMIKNGSKTYSSGDKLHINIPKIPLLQGKYWVDINLRIYPNIHVDRIKNMIPIFVYDSKIEKTSQLISNTENLGYIVLEDVLFSKV